MIELLKGVRVVECAVLATGDQAGRLLGDLGADVIKVERPGQGDYIREIGGNMGAPRHSTNHLLLNRNKRSVALDLRSDAGRSVFFDLIDTADVFVDGFAGGACAGLGIGYDEQVARNPGIVYLQVSGFGAAGPYSQIPTHGMMMTAAAAAIALEIGADGFVSEGPQSPELTFAGVTNPTLLVALFGVLTAVAALDQRRRTGVGTYIDASASDAVLAAQGTDWINTWNAARITPSSNPPLLPGLSTQERPKYAYYATLDRAIVMFAGIEPKFWKNFCLGIDRDDLLVVGDPTAVVDFRTPASGAELAEELRRVFASRTREEWIEFAQVHDVPIGPVNQRSEVIDDPNVRARGIIDEMTHAHAGSFVSVGWPAIVGGETFQTLRGAPLVGEHTDSVLTELGYDQGRIDRLRRDGAF